jgi:aminopeptidase N
MLEPDSRNEFMPRLAEASHDPAMIAKLDTYAEAHIPATARQATVRGKASIAYAAMVRDKRLPEVGAWLKRRH